MNNILKTVGHPKAIKQHRNYLLHTLLVLFDILELDSSHFMFLYLKKKNGILQNKESHMGLEQHEGQKMIFHFWVN